MKIFNLPAPVPFEIWCVWEGFSLEAHEREKKFSIGGVAPWYVTSDKLVEIRENGMLASVHGNGKDPESAKKDYAKKLAGRNLLIGGHDGHEVQAPYTWSDV